MHCHERVDVGNALQDCQTAPAEQTDQAGAAGNVSGFSLHAGVAVRANQRNKRERLCRYISRPALSEQRLSLTAGGNVRYKLKTPYDNGTTHVVFAPLDFLLKGSDPFTLNAFLKCFK